MDYRVISADCHIDLPWLPPDLFTANARTDLKDRMPFVADGEKGPVWTSKSGAQFGLQNGMGSGGREYIPGQINRSDRMAAEGLYDDGKKGIRRLTDPELRIKDQDRDGVQAEVLFGILGASQRLNDPEAATEMMRIYNVWLADFCDTHPDRFAGMAAIPNYDVTAAIEEIGRVAKRGSLKGLEVANSYDMKPLYHPDWDPLWKAIHESGLPMHFHTIGSKKPDLDSMPPLQARQGHAVYITGFQLGMARIIMEIIYGGALEALQRPALGDPTASPGWRPSPIMT